MGTYNAWGVTPVGGITYAGGSPMPTPWPRRRDLYKPTPRPPGGYPAVDASPAGGGGSASTVANGAPSIFQRAAGMTTATPLSFGNLSGLAPDAAQPVEGRGVMPTPMPAGRPVRSGGGGGVRYGFGDPTGPSGERYDAEGRRYGDGRKQIQGYRPTPAVQPILDDKGQPIEGRATGGPVQPGQPYVVGEQGPEVIVPTQAGTVIPNQMLTPEMRGPAMPRPKPSIVPTPSAMTPEMRGPAMPRPRPTIVPTPSSAAVPMPTPANPLPLAERDWAGAPDRGVNSPEMQPTPGWAAGAVPVSMRTPAMPRPKPSIVPTPSVPSGTPAAAAGGPVPANVPRAQGAGGLPLLPGMADKQFANSLTPFRKPAAPAVATPAGVDPKTWNKFMRTPAGLQQLLARQEADQQRKQAQADLQDRRNYEQQQRQQMKAEDITDTTVGLRGALTALQQAGHVSPEMLQMFEGADDPRVQSSIGNYLLKQGAAAAAEKLRLETEQAKMKQEREFALQNPPVVSIKQAPESNFNVVTSDGRYQGMIPRTKAAPQPRWVDLGNGTGYYADPQGDPLAPDKLFREQEAATYPGKGTVVKPGAGPKQMVPAYPKAKSDKQYYWNPSEAKLLELPAGVQPPSSYQLLNRKPDGAAVGLSGAMPAPAPSVKPTAPAARPVDTKVNKLSEQFKS